MLTRRKSRLLAEQSRLLAEQELSNRIAENAEMYEIAIERFKKAGRLCDRARAEYNLAGELFDTITRSLAEQKGDIRNKKDAERAK